MGLILGLMFGFMAPVVFIAAIIYFVKGRDDGEKSLSTKEFFLEVGIFTTLISSIVSFVYILFMAIDKKFQDVLSVNNYGYESVNSDLASMVSVLVVVFPLYLVFVWMKAKNFKQNPQRREIKAFEYGTYLAMFATVVFIIGSLIAIIYNFLMGELTAVFGYKVLVVSVVSAALFAYSYFSLKRDYTKATILPTVATLISLAVVILGVVYSVSVLGSPAEMRKKKFDELRLSNLSEIQNQVLNFWQREYVLPASLADIKGDGMNYSVISTKDPKTKNDYTYRVLENSVMTKTKGEECRNFYPNRFSTTPDVTNINCEVPSKAVFEICGTFDTVRVYDENGMDQSPIGFNTANEYGLMKVSAPTALSSYDMGYYGGGYDKNPNWNHDAGEYCFKRTLDPKKYTSYK